MFLCQIEQEHLEWRNGLKKDEVQALVQTVDKDLRCILKRSLTRLKGIKINRQHEFLSDLEQNHLHITEYLDLFIDIRGRFPY